jgi:hypothetical protein
MPNIECPMLNVEGEYRKMRKEYRMSNYECPILNAEVKAEAKN